MPNELGSLFGIATSDYTEWQSAGRQQQIDVDNLYQRATQQQSVSSGVALGHLSGNAAGRMEITNQLLESNLINADAAIRYIKLDFNNTTLDTATTSEITELQKMVKELMTRVEYLEDKLGLND